jgi:hypothetical protein
LPSAFRTRGVDKHDRGAACEQITLGENVGPRLGSFVALAFIRLQDEIEADAIDIPEQRLLALALNFVAKRRATAIVKLSGSGWATTPQCSMTCPAFWLSSILAIIPWSGATIAKTVCQAMPGLGGLANELERRGASLAPRNGPYLHFRSVRYQPGRRVGRWRARAVDFHQHEAMPIP